MNANGESLPIRTQDGTIIVFWDDVKQYGPASAPQFASVLMMRVSVPGDNKSNSEKEVQITYAEGHPHSLHGKVWRNDLVWPRFGKYIEEYVSRQGGPQAIVGTPVDQLPFVNRAMVNNLKHNGIYSAEDLAGLTDQGIASIGMGGRALVQRAKDFIATRQNAAAGMEAQERERKTEERFASLEKRHAALAEALEELPEEMQAQVKRKLVQQSKRNAA
tara:strand:+ start:198 stop:851 length:654 start_codon:yes stop_codon:yes gene_type:complete